MSFRGGPEGAEPRRSRRRTLPGVPKYLWPPVPSGASAGQPRALSRPPLPARVLPPPRPAPPPVSCLWQTPSAGRSAEVPRLALAAGVWGEWPGGGPPRPLRPSVGDGRGCQAGLAWSGVMAGSSGRRRAVSSRPSAAGATDPQLHLLSPRLGRIFRSFSCLSFVPSPPASFPSRWESAGSVSLVQFPLKMQAGAITSGLPGHGGVGRRPRLSQVPGLSRKRIPPS